MRRSGSVYGKKRSDPESSDALASNRFEWGRPVRADVRQCPGIPPRLVRFGVVQPVHLPGMVMATFAVAGNLAAHRGRPHPRAMAGVQGAGLRCEPKTPLLPVPTRGNLEVLGCRARMPRKPRESRRKCTVHCKDAMAFATQNAITNTCRPGLVRLGCSLRDCEAPQDAKRGTPLVNVVDSYLGAVRSTRSTAVDTPDHPGIEAEARVPSHGMQGETDRVRCDYVARVLSLPHCVTGISIGSTAETPSPSDRDHPPISSSRPCSTAAVQHIRHRD